MKTRMIGLRGLAAGMLGVQFVAGSLCADDQVAQSGDGTVPLIAPSDTAQSASAAPSLSQSANEIAKLAQSGLGDPVMMAYVNNARSKFNLGSDQIVYLNDLGVSSDVVKAMIEHDSAIDAAGYAYTQATSPVATQPPVAPVPSYPVAPPQIDVSTTPPPPDDMGNDTISDDGGYFYNSLSPYGNWIFAPGVGLCWQPTLCLANPNWQPYGDRGRWIDTDCGWYWQSDYSWGWAAFHYGRWFRDANHGWLWAPGRVWGPAWVSWRQSAQYAGWAPLPPEARFVSGAGLVSGNRTVTANYEFGLQPSQYTFVPLARLSDYAPARYATASWQASEVYSQTTLANHFGTANNHMVNQSIDPRTVVALAGVEIRHAQVREMSGVGNSDYISKRDGATYIYRPQLPAPATSRLMPGSQRPAVAPTRSSTQPHASISPAHFTVPIYLSGSSPAPVAEYYPSGSLVVIGKGGSTVTAMHANSSGQTYRVFNSASATTTRETGADAQSRFAVASAHYNNELSTPQYTHESTIEYRGGWQGEARVQPRNEARSDNHSESHIQAGGWNGGGGSHPANYSSSPANASSSSGHR